MFKQIMAIFQRPPAKTLAQEELEESQRKFLMHVSAAGYHSKVAEYYSTNIQRLELYVKKA